MQYISLVSFFFELIINIPKELVNIHLFFITIFFVLWENKYLRYYIIKIKTFRLKWSENKRHTKSVKAVTKKFLRSLGHVNYFPVYYTNSCLVVVAENMQGAKMYELVNHNKIKIRR